jgi:NitT/TauT family transport system substrate-binding protein
MATIASWQLFAALGLSLALGTGEAAAQVNCATMRKIAIGVSVAPPNVVHTTPYVAQELGYFTRHCI